MKITLRQLIGLPVMTRLGQTLGTVGDVDIDVDSSQIVSYQVRTVFSLKTLFKKNLLLINPTQVISLDDKKMIVEDNLTTDLATDNIVKQPALNVELD